MGRAGGELENRVGRTEGERLDQLQRVSGGRFTAEKQQALGEAGQSQGHESLIGQRQGEGESRVCPQNEHPLEEVQLQREKKLA